MSIYLKIAHPLSRSQSLLFRRGLDVRRRWVPAPGEVVGLFVFFFSCVGAYIKNRTKRVVSTLSL